MAMSRGGRGLVSDILGWSCVAGIAVAAIVYGQDLRSFAYDVAGIKLPEPSATDGRTAARNAASIATGRSANARAELQVGRNGHFYADAEINGRSIGVMVDTGASTIALTYEDANRIGVSPRPNDFTHRVNTANGIARVAPVTLDRVAIGDVMVRNVSAVVIEQGKLNNTLLGNSFLSKLSRYEMRDGRLVLEE